MRMSLRIKRILLTLASLLWMRLIFGFSAETAEQSSGLSAMVCRFLAGIFVRGYSCMSLSEQERITEGMQLYIRKGAHVTEYAVLGILLSATFTAYGLQRAYALALAAAILYAALDEYHQRFVPGRSGEIKDVLIDACGVLLGLAGALAAEHFMKKIKEMRTDRAPEAGPGI